MLQISFLEENKDQVIKGLKKRGFSDQKLAILDEVLDLDAQRKSSQTSLDELLSQVNSISKEIGDLYKSGQREQAESKKEAVAKLKEQISALQVEFDQVNEGLKNKLLQIPNVPNDLVPAGVSEEDNEVYQDLVGSKPELYQGAQPHWELGTDYDLFSLELGVKIAGAGFPVYKGQGARLQRALITFFLDEAVKAGYSEYIPPLMVNEASAYGTGNLPDKEGQMYHVTVDGFYLIPTAEVPLTNIYRDVILKEEDFPIKLTGYTPCFRREAGSYGKDVKGLNRVHQFDKIEIVQIVKPEKSPDALMEMLRHVEGLLKKLELPYRILRLCGGDLTFASTLTYDFEVYSGAQKRWLEVSSVSNFETFQSNRMKIRFRNERNKTQLVHTLNGSALALSRIVASILENNQTEEGIQIPKVLTPYTGFDWIRK